MKRCHRISRTFSDRSLSRSPKFCDKHKKWAVALENGYALVTYIQGVWDIYLDERDNKKNNKNVRREWFASGCPNFPRDPNAARTHRRYKSQIRFANLMTKSHSKSWVEKIQFAIGGDCEARRPYLRHGIGRRNGTSGSIIYVPITFRLQSTCIVLRNPWWCLWWRTRRPLLPESFHPTPAGHRKFPFFFLLHALTMFHLK